MKIKVCKPDVDAVKVIEEKDKDKAEVHEEIMHFVRNILNFNGTPDEIRFDYSDKE